MTTYYNEIDPYAAQWLRNLIAAGHIAPGDVDERSIVDIRGDDIRGYTQAHFFAGIGGWSVALRLAGWPDDRPVWTGSCPCQPFSAAGAGKAADDSRHLWPAWFPLIAECRPAIVFGEQVEAAIGWGWIDAVFADLEGEGYACGTAVLPACGVGAPHIRQRCWFVADSAWKSRRSGDGRGRSEGDGEKGSDEYARRSRASGLVADANGRDASAEGLQRGGEQRQQPQDGSLGDLAHSAGGGFREFGDAPQPRRGGHPDRDGEPDELGNADGAGRPLRIRDAGDDGAASGSVRGQAAKPASHWSDCDWLPCTDGRARPVEPGSFPLAHGVQRRPSKLRAYGNAIVPQVAAEFIAAATAIIPER